MPFNQPQRTDSWPPTVLRLSAADESKDKDIDSAALKLHSRNEDAVQEEHDDLEDNPFSYFLSSPEDSDDDEDLSAGIETPESQAVTPIIRTVSPSDFQRQFPAEALSPVSSEEDYVYDAELLDSDDFDLGLSFPLTLREFSDSIRKAESRPRLGRTQSLSRLSQAKDEESNKPLKFSGPIRSHFRGRTPSQHIPSSSRRLRADTYPVRRPHSWRRPSDDVFTIPEESSSASNSSKESLESKKAKHEQSKPQTSSPKLTLTVPSTSSPAWAFEQDSKDSMTPPLKLKGTLEGEDPTQISVWERNVESRKSSKGQKMFSALGSPVSTPTSYEDDEDRSSARMTVLEETPFPTEPVLRMPLRRKKTVRFALPPESMD